MSQTVTGRNSIILISDGIDCSEDQFLYFGYGSQHTLDEALTLAQSVGVPVSAIALGKSPSTNVAPEGYDETRLKQTASTTGGSYYHLPTADQLAELYRSISKQTQEEYVITYKSPRPDYDGGTCRNIQVNVNIKGTDTQQVTSQSTYLENHLVNIQSNLLLGAIIFLPLLLAAFLPLPFLFSKSKSLQMKQSGTKGQEVDRSPYPSGQSDPEQRPFKQGSKAQVCPHRGNPLRSGARASVQYVEKA